MVLLIILKRERSYVSLACAHNRTRTQRLLSIPLGNVTQATASTNWLRKDAYDAMAHHQMVVDEQGKAVAIGRLYINADNEAAIRFLAVAPSVRNKGLGTLVAMTLESVARQEGSNEWCVARVRMP